MRQHDPHRPDDVGSSFEQDLPLSQRLANQAELVIFEIAQAAVNVFAGSRACALCEIALLAQDHAKTPAGGIARDSSPVDPSADDQKIDDSTVAGGHLHIPWAERSLW